MKTEDFLFEIINQNQLNNTTYALAKYMGKKYGWSRPTIINYKKGRTHPDDKAAIDIAAELNLDPAFVIASIHAERCKEPAIKRVWQRLSDMTRSSHASAVFAFTILITPLLSNIYTFLNSWQCILC